MELTHIRAIYTPDSPPTIEKPGLKVGGLESVDIVGFSDDGVVAIYISGKGDLKSASLRHFSSCVFVTL